MPTMKNILVTGATGNQGGAVIDALLRENEEKGAQEWKIFALTRSASGGKAKQLVTKGKGAVELVEGDLNDAKFMSSWVTPEKDLYAIFAVTMMGKGEVALCLFDKCHGLNKLTYAVLDRAGYLDRRSSAQSGRQTLYLHVRGRCRAQNGRASL